MCESPGEWHEERFRVEKPLSSTATFTFFSSLWMTHQFAGFILSGCKSHSLTPGNSLQWRPQKVCQNNAVTHVMFSLFFVFFSIQGENRLPTFCVNSRSLCVTACLVTCTFCSFNHVGRRAPRFWKLSPPRALTAPFAIRCMHMH